MRLNDLNVESDCYAHHHIWICHKIYIIAVAWSRAWDLVAGDCTRSTRDGQSRSSLIQTSRARFSAIVWLITNAG